MSYELFKRTSIRVDSPTFGIRPDGRIAVNAAACRIMSEAGIKAVVLLWDSSARRVAIKAAPKGDKNAFAIARSGHSGIIGARTFTRYIRWNASSRQTLPGVWNASEKMFEINLPRQY